MDPNQIIFSKCHNISRELLDRYLETGGKGYDPSTLKFSLPETFAPFGEKSYITSYRISRWLLAKGFEKPLCLVTTKKCFVKGDSLAATNLFGKQYTAERQRLVDSILKQKLSSDLWSHDIPYRISDHKVPFPTPNLVTSFFVLNLFWKLIKEGQSQYIPLFIKACGSAFAVFHFSVVPNGICFRYIPKFNYFVHNANIMMALMLARSSQVDSNFHSQRFIEKAVSHTVSEYEKGHYSYSSFGRKNSTVDNYHTGYVIRFLNEITQYGVLSLELNHRSCKLVKLMVDDYVALFCRNGFVFKSSTDYICSHSLAEAILIFKTFRGYSWFQREEELLSAIQNTLPSLITPDLILANAAILKKENPKIISTAYYPRWSYAWMIFALGFKVEGEQQQQ